MTDEKQRNHDEQVVVTLALIQKALEDLTLRVSDHHRVLFGNGNPEDSILWAVKSLNISITTLSKKVEKLADSHITTVSNTEDLTWKQWTKKFVMRYFPFIFGIIILSIIFHGPLTAVITAISGLIGG